MQQFLKNFNFEKILAIDDDETTHQQENMRFKKIIQKIQNDTREFAQQLRQKNLQENYNKAIQDNQNEKKKQNKALVKSKISKFISKQKQKLSNNQASETQNFLVDNSYNNNLHQHAVYFPVTENLQLTDILSKLFTSFASQYSDQKFQKYDEISEYNWSDLPDFSWEKVLQQYQMQVDLEKIIQIYLFFKYERYSPITEKFIKNHYGFIYLYRITLEEMIKEIDKIVGIGTKIKDFPITIDESNPINEATLVKTYKEFFCIICSVYDCQTHGLNQTDNKNYYQPATSGRKLDYEKLKFLNNYYYSKIKSIPQNPLRTRQKLADLPQNPEEEEQYKPCSKNCFFKLTKDEYRKLKSYYANPVNQLSEVSKSFIHLGIQNFSYDPCKIWMLNYKELTCEMVFLYLYEDLEIHSEKYQNIVHVGDFQLNFKDKIQKKIKREQAIMPEQGMAYQPCMHHSYTGNEETEEQQSCKNCVCAERKFCDKYCLCDPAKCTIRRKGCVCTGDCSAKKCDCFGAGLECDPDLCKNCFKTCGSEKKNKCKNNQITLGISARTIISRSKICTGLGLFASEPIKKGTLVQEYLGEYIETYEGQLREKFDGNNSFYSFQLTNQDKLIDGKFFGNKSRYINHSSNQANTLPKVIYAQGDWHLGLYALKDIEIGQELLFDYDGDGTLKGMFGWIEQETQTKNKKKGAQNNNNSNNNNNNNNNSNNNNNNNNSNKPKDNDKLYSSGEEFDEDSDSESQDDMIIDLKL